jgi:hypothetical protein
LINLESRFLYPWPILLLNPFTVSTLRGYPFEARRDSNPEICPFSFGLWIQVSAH